MGTPRIPNQKKRYATLNERLNNYVKQIYAIYSVVAKKAANIVTKVARFTDGNFSFKNFPETTADIQNIQSYYRNSIKGVIYNGISEEWKNSNLAQDLIAKKVIKTYDVEVHSKKETYFSFNDNALKAFRTRKDNGMNISTKIWKLSSDVQKELEVAISTALEKGISAITLSKRISRYLNDFDKLQKDYAKKFGHAADISNCEWRSARLARSEINMAYRTAEQTRWRQMDFIKGFTIKTSGNHPKKDICDELQGNYPKSFHWTGWHPNCMCYEIPIIMSDDEYWGAKKNEISDLPENFKQWVKENEERISKWQKNGKAPYFIRDNELAIQTVEAMRKARETGDVTQTIAENIASKYGATCTPINYKSSKSIMKKTLAERARNPNFMPSDIKDLARTTIVVERGKIDDVYNELCKRKDCVRGKIQDGPEFIGYTGRIINLKMPNGLITEIQVNTPKMIYAKETPAVAKSIIGEEKWNDIRHETGQEGGRGHKYYEKCRELPEGDAKNEIKKESIAYYSHFRD